MSRHVLVTGGTSGIGFASARLLAKAGAARIVLNGRNESRGAAAVQRLTAEFPGCTTTFFSADVSSASAAATLMDEAQHRLDGRVDVLVTAAGGDHSPAIFGTMALPEIAGMVERWLLSTMFCCRLALPMIPSGGAIVTVASDAAKVPTPGESVVGAAMAGIVMFARTLAMELKRQGIRVNAVTPSLVTGTLTYDRITRGGFSARLFEKAAAAAHLGLPDPEDVAAAVVFLASPASSKMTGQILSVNGGISAG